MARLKRSAALASISTLEPGLRGSSRGATSRAHFTSLFHFSLPCASPVGAPAGRQGRAPWPRSHA
eukprot:1681227-Pyramimonas_sp.AAC.1